MKLTAILPAVLCVSLLGACGEPSTPRPKTDAPAQNAAQPSASPVSNAEAAPAAEKSKMAPTPGTVTRDTELKDKPFMDAKTLKRLPAKTAVAIVDRSGGWLRVTSAGQTGWVRMLHVSSQPPGQSNTSKQDLEAAAKIATGRAGSGNIVSTTGIRGLDEAQLRDAKPNLEELKRLDGYAVNNDQATAYARNNKLERRQIAYLPEPR